MRPPFKIFQGIQQAGLSDGATAGEILGLSINGTVSELLGYRKTMMVSLVAVSAFVFILFFANNLIALEVERSFADSMGRFPSTYHQLRIRGLPNCITGISDDPYEFLLSNGPIHCEWSSTLDTSSTRSVKLQVSIGRIRCLLANRIPLVIQWTWAVPIIIRVLLAPRSPR
jgi:SP family general alpha glucoside:H+ symporter-like MFS transporter